jgi:hypothetical protein
VARDDLADVPSSQAALPKLQELLELVGVGFLSSRKFEGAEAAKASRLAICLPHFVTPSLDLTMWVWLDIV